MTSNKPPEYADVEYHLTRTGWVPGTSTQWGIGEDLVPPPDRILTVRSRERYGSEWTKPNQQRVMVWKYPDMRIEEITEIAAQFGDPEGALSE